ncbi:MAG: leucine-rich repeat protein [Ruminococcus sp.]
MKNYDYDSNQSPVYNNSDVKKIVIEDGVTSIGDYAFRGCSSLTSITLPDSVTSIGDCAFVFCVGLSSITLPDSVTSIGDSAFKNCSSLTSITIPDRVTSIEPYAFDNCSSLTSITIPNSVTSIGASAFYNCRSLTSITIPDRVTSIESRAFTGCSSLTSITIPDSVTSIGYATFTGCSSLTSITIPDSVTSIGYATFAGCSSLTSITIPDSVTSIGESAFSNCSSLQTISLSCKSTLKRSDFGDQADLVSYALHTLKKTEAKAATYTENGNKAYWTCEHCGKYFLSDDSNSETAKAIELSETVIPALVQIATTTTPIKCVYGQDMNKIDMRDYVKNTDVVGEVTVKVTTGSTLPDGMKLDNGKISGKPAKAYEDGKEVTFTFTAENGSTANLTLLFLVAKADPTVEVAVSGDLHTEGDLVSELKLILSENSTKGVVELVSEIKALVAGKNTLTWKFTPEDENNYHTVTGTVVVNAQTTTTTTTTTKATTTTTKATTTTKPNKMTTTNVTTTMKSSKTTTTKATTTTKPSKTTTTNATTTTKPNKTTTTKVTTTTKPNKTTTTKATTTTTTTISSYGDVNLDGKVDIVDAIFLNKYLATLIQFSDAQVANADCYQDGVLNDQDTTALMQFIILLIDDLPVQPTEK